NSHAGDAPRDRLPVYPGNVRLAMLVCGVYVQPEVRLPSAVAFAGNDSEVAVTRPAAKMGVQPPPANPAAAPFATGRAPEYVSTAAALPDPVRLGSTMTTTSSTAMTTATATPR